MISIAVDASGGDLGSAPVLTGIRDSLKVDQNLSIKLFCDAESYREASQDSAFPKALRDRIDLRLCSESVTMEEKPLQALRNKASSSMAEALKSLANEESQAMLSSGNTAALVGFGLQILGTIPGISRPAICTALPSKKGRTWFLDMGANLEPSLEQMLDNALMGAAQCRLVEGIERPRVGVLNVGSESMKGKRIEQELAAELSKQKDINFAGFAEGADLFSGDFNLIVCDGFAGNVALKTAEGVADFLSDQLKTLLNNDWAARFCYLLLRHDLRNLRRRIDPAKYNGASLLGLNGLVVKSHGASTSNGFQNALNATADLVRMGGLPYLKESIASTKAEMSA